MGWFSGFGRTPAPGAMYQVDDLDRVVALEGFPQSSVGAPCPMVLSDEFSTVIAFYIEEPDPNWDGTSVRVVGPDSNDERIAIVSFDSSAYFFGPPNDEAFDGHPLASRGLGPYSAVLVERSSWVRGLERMNSVHPQHRPENFDDLKHFILSFHDSVFECVARSYRVELCVGSINSALPRMAELLAKR